MNKQKEITIKEQKSFVEKSIPTFSDSQHSKDDSAGISPIQINNFSSSLASKEYQEFSRKSDTPFKFSLGPQDQSYSAVTPDNNKIPKFTLEPEDTNALQNTNYQAPLGAPFKKTPESTGSRLLRKSDLPKPPEALFHNHETIKKIAPHLYDSSHISKIKIEAKKRSSAMSFNYKGDSITDTESGVQIPSGVGEQKFSDGSSKYIGTFSNGKYHGKGIRYYASGAICYEGNWQSGQFHGKGILNYVNGAKQFEGEWQHGKFTGYGKEYSLNSCIKYSGNWVDGKRQGKGASHYENGSIKYEGNWSQDHIKGKGIAYYSSGIKEYEGEFAQGEKYHGYGTKYQHDGNLAYVGHWKNGLESGSGVRYDRDGIKFFEGEFNEGESTGKGCFYDIDGGLVKKKADQNRYRHSLVNNMMHLNWVKNPVYDSPEKKRNTQIVEGKNKKKAKSPIKSRRLTQETINLERKYSL